MSDQGERAARGDTPALRCAARELPSGTKAGRAVVERVQSERGTIAPPRYAALRANCHPEQKRGVPSWSACDSGAEREHPTRSATLRAKPSGAPWSLRSALAPLRAHPCGSPSFAAARKAAPDMEGCAAAGGGGGFMTPYRRRSLESVGESVGMRVKVWAGARVVRGAGVDSPRTPPPLSPSPYAGGGYFI